ncbi:MAG TPA: phosphodiester glycosidase family protein [Bacillota bacterium]|nr:phosphodiester glycosidase family protein [Bacillota bacterium]
MKKLKNALSVTLAFLLLFSVLLPSAAIGSSGISSLKGLGLNYTTFNYTDSSSASGIVHSLVYDPEDSNVLAYVDNGNSGWQFKTLATATRCEQYTDYNVVAGVNNEFFSMSTGTAGVLVGYGMYITDGRIAQAQTGTEGTVLAFGSDGSIDAIKSKLAYKLCVNGTEWKNGSSSALTFINKRSSEWSSGIYLWDSCCGTKTDSVESAPGIEIVCEKLENTEISVGRTCTAKVVEIRTDSYCSEFTSDQFVLFIKNGSSLQTYAKTIKVGDQIDIAVEESISSSKDIMKSAHTATSVLFDAFVVNKKAVSSVISSLPAYSTERPRTGIGFKADGTVVILVAEGDDVNGANGVTCDTFAKMFIDAGCVTAYNLDGGGSSQLVLDNNGTLEQVYGTGRGVANSILLIERGGSDAIDDDIAAALNSAIKGVTSEMKKDSAIKAAYNAAVAVKGNKLSMTGDYRNALYDLNQAVGVRTKLLSLVAEIYDDASYSDYSAHAWKQLRTALSSANKALADSSATQATLNMAYLSLKSAYAATGSITHNIAAGRSYTRSGVWATTPNYDDANNTELTDGDYGTPGYGACWTGFHKTFLENGYHVVTLDLGEKYKSLSGVTMTFYYDSAAGCTLPTKITVYTSDSATSGFTQAGVNSSITIPGSIQLVTPEIDLGSASGRYVQIKWNSTGSFSFVSEIEVNVTYSPKLDPVASADRDLGDNPNIEGDESKEESKTESKEESKTESTEPSKEQSDESDIVSDESTNESSEVSDESIEASGESVEESDESAEVSDESVEESAEQSDASEQAESSQESNTDDEKGSGVWLYVGIGIAVLAAAAAVIIIILKKKPKAQ